MSELVELAWVGNDGPRYDHGPQHPLRPERFVLTRSLIHAYGMVDGDRVVERAGRNATDEELMLVHTSGYIDVVKRAGNGEQGPWWEFGFGPGDNPIFPLMHDAAARVAGTTLAAAEAVWSGRAEHAFSPAGGLHHAMPGRASGFCVYDDPAIAIAWFLAQGAARVAYVDVDVHHGDGPQAIFYDDPRVLTISLHQDGRTLFPGTGSVGETGSGDAVGSAVNVALPPLTGDDLWVRAFEETVVPLVDAWRPDVLVTQLGCDTHLTDPLANLCLTTAAYRRAARTLHELAHAAAGGRWLATGGGGYQWASVVPRAWTIYFAEMTGSELPDELPESWIAQAVSLGGDEVPSRLGDPLTARVEGDGEAVSRVIADVKQQVFGYHGLG